MLFKIFKSERLANYNFGLCFVNSLCKRIVQTFMLREILHRSPYAISGRKNLSTLPIGKWLFITEELSVIHFYFTHQLN